MKSQYRSGRLRTGARAAVALIASAGMVLASVVPSNAATVVSQSTAQAVNIHLLSAVDVAASDPPTSASSDGSATDGPNTASPSPSLLPGNGFLTAGSLSEVAEANRDGSSYACASVSSSGGVIQVEDGGQTCTTTGGTGSASLDLSKIPGVGGLLSSVANVTLTADSLTGHAYDSGTTAPTGEGAINNLHANVCVLAILGGPCTLNLDLPITVTSAPNQNLLPAIVEALTSQNNILLLPLINLLSTTLTPIVSLQANYQTTLPDGSFKVSALHVSLLQTAGAESDIALVTVGPNAGLVTPTITSLVPDHGPAVGGTTVTITGTGFQQGLASVDFGDNTVAPGDVTVVSGTQLIVSSPAHAPGAVDVTVSNGPGATSGPVTFTYDVVPSPVITSPTNGGTVTTGTPVISGTGTPGDTVTVTEGTTTLCTTTVQPDNSWSCTPATPLAPGSHMITATQTDTDGNPSAPSAPVTFTVTDVPGAPITLTATAGNAYVNLTWSKPIFDGGSRILGYNVYMGTDAGGEATTPVNGGTLVPGLGYQATGLTNGTTYYFIVKAVNAVGSSLASNEASATPSAAACPPPFLDVPSSNPFCADITWMKDTGVTKGYPDDTFRPIAPATRGMMAAFVYRQLNPGTADPTCTTKPYSDVEIDNPVCGDITWLKDNGVTQGYDDGTFRPVAPISRQGIAAFMFRMNNLGEPEPTCSTKPFPDVETDNTFCGDIAWMKDTGISYGGTGGMYYPLAQTTRQAVAGLVHRMVTVLYD